MVRRIIEDTRNQIGRHTTKRNWFEANGIEVVRKKINYGDYALSTDAPRVAIDTKRSVAEVAQNISRDHERFKRECLRARDANARLIVLVENEHGYLTIPDVARWVNDECRRCRMRGFCDPGGKGPCVNQRHKKSRRKPIQGPRLALAMQTMGERYGVEFMFCHPSQSAPIIASILADEEARSERDG